MIVLTRALGRRKQLLDDWSVDLPPNDDPGGGEWTLRDLISGIVIKSVKAFRLRQESNRFVCVLSQRQIEQQAARGKIDQAGETSSKAWMRWRRSALHSRLSRMVCTLWSSTALSTATSTRRSL